ncbi:MAG: sensor histidine kinase, partial [Rhodobacteraceae bacterium]|nr:sensor histidine kinase [Paracoccaceae bacterium]
KQRKIIISRVVPPQPVMIHGDRLRLEQVLVNLLCNALDATKSTEEPEIGILLAAGEVVRLSVRDNGAGIDDLDALFEPFYTTKQPGDGVGLGLAISSGIIKDLGGRLTARNASNGGAVFVIELPVMGQASYEAETDAAE